MRPTEKPRSKKQQNPVKSTSGKSVEQSKYPTADLGDTDTSSSAGEELVTDDLGFHSPPPETDGTDYGLDFTRTGTRYLADTSTCHPPVTADLTLDQQTEKNNNKIKPKKAKTTKIPAPSNQATVPVVNSKNAQSITKTTGVSKRVAQKRQAQRDLKFLKSYKKLAARVDYMIPRAAFARIVREIMLSLDTDVQYITRSALEALQTATEAYVQGRLEDANLLALHARRITLMAKDMELINFLRFNQR